MRAVFETLGIQDIVAKSMGTSNPYNMVRATFDALKHEDSPRSVAARRGVKVSALQARRRDADRGRGGGGSLRRLGNGRQDHHRRADRQPDPPARSTSAQTLIGLGLNKMHRRSTLKDTPGGPRHDRQGPPPRPRR